MTGSTGNLGHYPQKMRSLCPECTLFLKRSGKLPLPGPCEIALYGAGARHTAMGAPGGGPAVSVEEGLLQAGFQIMTKDWLDRYDELRGKKPRARRGKRRPGPEEDNRRMPLEQRCNTAVYVLTRLSHKGDRSRAPGDLLLTAEEQRDILALGAMYPVFLLVLNTAGPVDLSPVLPYTDDILLLGQLGTETGAVLAGILLGQSFPSGKLTVTWAFPEHPQRRTDTRTHYYKEGIYSGYRYFDSAPEPTLFPFGFGLGYTDFRLTPGEVLLAGGQVTAYVLVQNIGAFPGKEVVQLYLSSPWGELDQPPKALAAFGKTKLLSPGESCRLELRFRLEDLAGFSTRRQAYVLEQGDYVLYCGSSSKALRPMALLRLGRTVETMQVQGAIEDPGFADWKPEKPRPVPQGLPVCTVDGDTLKARAPAWDDTDRQTGSTRDFRDEDLVRLCLGDFGGKKEPCPGAAGETTSALKGIPALTMARGPQGLLLGWKEPEKQEPRRVFGRKTGKKTPKKQGKRLFSTAVPVAVSMAQSFDLAAAESFGDVIGEEMEGLGVHLWLAPVLDLYRSVLCGENYERCSEDPLVSGLMAAALTRGVQRHPGRGVVIGSFAPRPWPGKARGADSRISQRALREGPLRAFALCIREGGPLGVMTAPDLSNGFPTALRRDLIENVLRRELGFRGVVIADWGREARGKTQGKRRPASNGAMTVLAGGDLFLPGTREEFDRCLRALRTGTLPRPRLEHSAARVLALVEQLTKNGEGNSVDS